MRKIGVGNRGEPAQRTNTIGIRRSKRNARCKSRAERQKDWAEASAQDWSGTAPGNLHHGGYFRRVSSSKTVGRFSKSERCADHAGRRDSRGRRSSRGL